MQSQLLTDHPRFRGERDNTPRPNRPPRIAIVGTGMVGATAAYGILLSGLAAELILINRDKKRAQAHADDLRDAQIFSHASRIVAGDLSECWDADIVLVTAGASQSGQNTSRLDNLKESAAILRSIIPAIASQNASAIFVIATNPVDVLTYAAWKWSGLPASRVLGSGTSLDTSRLRRRLGEYYGVAPANVHAYIIGEHGDSQVPLLSSAQLAGIPLTQFCAQQGLPCHDALLKKLADKARTGGQDILRAKGATYYGIGTALARIARNILRDEHAVMTVSGLVPASMGLGEVCLSLPTILGRSGISRVVAPLLSADEQDALECSAELLKRHIATVG
jgi:L-lactate dehydrogenase